MRALLGALALLLPCCGLQEQQRAQEAAEQQGLVRFALIAKLEKEGKIRKRFVKDVIAERVAIGMNGYEIFSAWGAPTRMNSSVSATGRRVQSVYERPGGTQYVHTLNGVVVYLSSYQR